MARLRRLSTRTLILGAALLTVLAVAGAAFARSALDDGAPPPKPLDAAVHDALAGPAPDGLTADVRLKLALVDEGVLPGGIAPLLSGATGQLAVANDGRFRLALDTSLGQVVAAGDRTALQLYVPLTRTVYRLALPAGLEVVGGQHAAPSVGAIDEALTHLRDAVDVSGATPVRVGGRPAYRVQLTPQHDAGLLGALSVAFDADHGTPLSITLTTASQTQPVLDLELSNVGYGTPTDDQLALGAPADAQVVNVDAAKGAAAARHAAGAVEPRATGLDAVRAAADFPVAAPDTLVGLDRREVVLADVGGQPTAVAVYGKGLGAVLVAERAGGGDATGSLGALLPELSVAGSHGWELPTALGTALHFERGTVGYTLAGSLPASAAEQAARELAAAPAS